MYGKILLQNLFLAFLFFIFLLLMQIFRNLYDIVEQLIALFTRHAFFILSERLNSCSILSVTK